MNSSSINRTNLGGNNYHIKKSNQVSNLKKNMVKINNTKIGNNLDTSNSNNVQNLIKSISKKELFSSADFGKGVRKKNNILEQKLKHSQLDQNKCKLLFFLKNSPLPC